MKLTYKLSKVASLFTASLFLAVLAVMVSCSEDDSTFVNHAKVRVATMGEFINHSDGSVARVSSPLAAYSDMPVLQFEDETAFNESVAKLKNMPENERISYLKAIGFESAEQILENADKELDEIFNIDDENNFNTALEEYKAKYQNILAFDDADEYDVTPYLSFSDSVMSIVGNAKGYVVIGNNLVSPSNMTPNIDKIKAFSSSTTMQLAPIEPGFLGFSNCSLTIKNGKYKSTMTLGRIVNGNSFAVKFVTKKKQFLWKKTVKASYSLNLGISGKKGHYSHDVVCPYGKNCTILNTPVETFGNPIDVTVSNFKSNMGNAAGSASFKTVQIK